MCSPITRGKYPPQSGPHRVENTCTTHPIVLASHSVTYTSLIWRRQLEGNVSPAVQHLKQTFANSCIIRTCKFVKKNSHTFKAVQAVQLCWQGLCWKVVKKGNEGHSMPEMFTFLCFIIICFSHSHLWAQRCSSAGPGKCHFCPLSHLLIQCYKIYVIWLMKMRCTSGST